LINVPQCEGLRGPAQIPRIPIPRTWVNKGRKKKEPELRRPSPWPNGFAALLCDFWFWAASSSTSFLPRRMKYAGTAVIVKHLRRSVWVSASRLGRRSLLTWGFRIFRYNRYRYDQHHRRHDQPHRNHHKDAPHKPYLPYSRAGLVSPAALRNNVSMKRLRDLAQLPRIPIRRSSQNFYSTHSGE
jgi:hypothetical protein